MGFISFAILGIIAAVIAKLILRQKVGWFLTFVLGILGAMVGGWISGFFFPDVYGANGFWSIASWGFAIAGALIVFLIYGLITGRRRAS